MKTDVITAYYAQLAGILEYPDENYVAKVQSVQRFLEAAFPDQADTFRKFSEKVVPLSKEEIQELHTRSFDIQAITTLDVGFLLFGDDYKRGKLLSNLNAEHRAVDNPCGHELADHLPNLLRLLPRLKDRNLAFDLVTKIIMPGLYKMIHDFDVGSLEAKRKEYLKNYKIVLDDVLAYRAVYQYPLRVVYALLQKEFPYVAEEPTIMQSDFLKSIGSEISIENKFGGDI